jgi:hypothetical protein
MAQHTKSYQVGIAVVFAVLVSVVNLQPPWARVATHATPPTIALLNARLQSSIELGWVATDSEIGRDNLRSSLASDRAERKSVFGELRWLSREGRSALGAVPDTRLSRSARMDLHLAPALSQASAATCNRKVLFSTARLYKHVPLAYHALDYDAAISRAGDGAVSPPRLSGEEATATGAGFLDLPPFAVAVHSSIVTPRLWRINSPIVPEVV